MPPIPIDFLELFVMTDTKRDRLPENIPDDRNKIHALFCKAGYLPRELRLAEFPDAGLTAFVGDGHDGFIILDGF